MKKIDRIITTELNYRNHVNYKISNGILTIKAVQKLIGMFLRFMRSTIITFTEIGLIFLFKGYLFSHLFCFVFPQQLLVENLLLLYIFSRTIL